jgi:hypothetical protein
MAGQFAIDEIFFTGEKRLRWNEDVDPAGIKSRI